MLLKKKPEPGVFKIETRSIANPVMRAGLGLTRGIIEKSLRFPELNSLYRQTMAISRQAPALSFARRALQAMNVTWKVHASEENPFPAAGPVVVVANHPFGGIEGMLLLALLEPFRRDVKVLANYLLARLPETRDSFIFVDPFGFARSARVNVRPLRQALGWLREGHVLGVFPAGEVSSVDIRTGQVRDPAWSPSVAAIVRRTQATVVPVFFAGHNGPLFNLAGMLHPRLRTLMLPQQLVNKRNRELSVQIGRAIAWREMAEYAADEQLIQYLRLRTYILAEREPRPTRLPAALPFKRRGKRRLPVAAAGPPEAQAREIAALPPDHLLLSAGELRVYHSGAGHIPEVLRELGRLREITFRAVGEGTGKPLDIDRFDETYLHLFIWNEERHEIVGAYRLGLADEIVAAQGVKGLYTSTCFRFDERLMRHLQPAIELGRSFVRPEYQKAFSPLLLLWRGIGAFVARHPRYTHLFGPVSITNEYRDASRNLILRSLRFSNFEHELARLVRPRRRPRRPRRAEWNLPDFHPYVDNIEMVSTLVQEIENDQKGIPILLRQYLKLGGRLLAFNVDPDFSDALDCLIAVNILRTDPRALRRYMGADEANTYRAHHGLPPI